jgi:hypothetical protein
VSVYGLQAAWKIGRGPDRTRRVHFQMDSFSQAESLQPKLNHLLGESTPYQCSFVSKMLNRITYDLLDRTSIDKLFKNPPVIDHQTFYPSVPRYIQPVVRPNNKFSHRFFSLRLDSDSICPKCQTTMRHICRWHRRDFQKHRHTLWCTNVTHHPTLLLLPHSSRTSHCPVPALSAAH